MGRTFFKVCKQLFGAIWKLFLMVMYALAKAVQLLAEMTAKITEKFI